MIRDSKFEIRNWKNQDLYFNLESRIGFLMIGETPGYYRMNSVQDPGGLIGYAYWKYCDMDPSIPSFFGDLHRKCVDGILRRIAGYYGARMMSLVVFGSYARGEQRLNSDLDLLIVLRSGSWSHRSERTEEFVRSVEQFCDSDLQALFENGISMELSPIILTHDEAQGFLPLYLDMVNNSLIIEDREGFFAGVLEKVKRQMAQWGSEHIKVSGHWLWEIRPGLKWDEVLHYDE